MGPNQYDACSEQKGDGLRALIHGQGAKKLVYVRQGKKNQSSLTHSNGFKVDRCFFTAFLLIVFSLLGQLQGVLHEAGTTAARSIRTLTWRPHTFSVSLSLAMNTLKCS